MKKIKFLSIVIFLFVGMFVFFQSCQRESLETSQISNQSTSNDLFMKVISLDELLSENNKDVSFKSVEHLFKKNRINQRIDATDNSFSILTDDIVVTSYQDSLNSYSFVIETPTDSTSVFENFIIKEEAISQYSYWIFRYKYNFNNSNFDITYQNIDQEVINLDDFSNILSRQTYQLFIQGGCLYVQYWIYYSSNDYWGWSSPFLVFCGGAGNSSGSSGSSNDTNNDPNDYGEYNHFQGGSLEFYDANGESGIGSSNDNDSSSNEIDPILGTNIPIDFQLTLQLAYLLNIDVFDSNNQQWINQVESLIKTQDKINIIQFILDNNSSQQALEFTALAVLYISTGNEFNLDDFDEFQQFIPPYQERMSPDELERFNELIPEIQARYLYNAYLASNKAMSLFPECARPTGAFHNDQADAFRHAYFHGLNTHFIGYNLSLELGTLHENDTPSEYELEKIMDLFNNEVGRQKALNPNILMNAVGVLQTRILIAIDNGELVYLNPINYNDPNYWDNPSTTTFGDGTHGITSSTVLIPTP